MIIRAILTSVMLCVGTSSCGEQSSSDVSSTAATDEKPTTPKGSGGPEPKAPVAEDPNPRAQPSSVAPAAGPSSTDAAAQRPDEGRAPSDVSSGRGMDGGAVPPDASSSIEELPWPPPLEELDAGRRDAEQRFEALAGCSSMAACDVVVLSTEEDGEQSYDNSAARCVVAELRQNNAGVFRHVQVVKGDEGFTVETNMLLHPVRLVEVTTRQLAADGTVTGYSGQLCTLSAQVPEQCLADLPRDDGLLPGAPACAGPQAWLAECLSLAETSVPAAPPCRED